MKTGCCIELQARVAEMEVVREEALKRWDATGEARRLFHGRGHMFPGFEHISVTSWPPYLQIALHNEADERFINHLLEMIVEALPGLEGVVLQRRDGRRTQSEVRFGEIPDEVQVREHGLSYWIQPKRNQNVGLFLDMGHVREELQETWRDKRVLNLFAYTCAFSVHAIAHGARQVVNNDMSKNALAIGTRNHQSNQHDLRSVRTIPHNLFKSWWKIRQFGPYDIVVVDPPTNQRGSFVAEKSYGQVLKRLPDMMSEDGVIVASLNSPFLGSDFLENQLARWVPSARKVLQYPMHPDFPDAFPERALKVMKYQLT